MPDDALRALAATAGVAVDWLDFRDEPQRVSVETLRAVLRALDLPCDSAAQIAESRARLAQETGAAPAVTTRAFTLDELAPGQRLWGIAAQLYALRRPRDGGLGDFTALTELVRAAAAAGADTVAISPAHALFAADVSRHSPYAPSTRLFLNPLHVDPAVLAPVAADDASAPLETQPLIDWPSAAALRWRRLRALFEQCAASCAAELAAFRRERGAALEAHACFEALHADQLAHHDRRDWRDWPAALREPASPAVAAFAREHAREIEFHVFAQWLADRGLAAAQAAARDAGMRIGLVADLAVGTDPGGSHAWSRPQDMLRGLSVGAPPDLLNLQGQNWALTTFSPRALVRNDFAPFAEMLDAALRHAGGVRIDHVLGLNRLWVIPQGADPRQGAYLRYPLAALLGQVAQASQRHRAIVIGEDLGTVPPELPPQLAAAGLLGMRVLWFTRRGPDFADPALWPQPVLATTSTHDLPTVAGWWEGRDLEWRAQTDTADPAAAQRARQDREHDRDALLAAFARSGLGRPHETAAVVDAALRYVARTPAQLALFPLEDLAGLVEQPNLPGTTYQHPNWRRRMPLPSAELLARPAVAARLAAIRRERA